MEIHNADLRFGPLHYSNSPELIILHHSVVFPASVEQIHRAHLAKGWAGIGYHYYVRQNGEVWYGRPEKANGAHTRGKNSRSIGICFEGNFENSVPSVAQRQAGNRLIADIRRRRGNLPVGFHRYYAATACPGKNFTLLVDTQPEEEDVAAKNHVLTGFVRPDRVRAVQHALENLGVRAYIHDPDTARIIRINPPDTEEK